MNSELLKQYAELRAAIKQMEEQENTMRTEVLDYLKTLGQATLQTTFGTFSIAKKTTWEYSEAIKKRELELKEAKAVEVEVGAAKAKETDYLRFQQ